MHDNKQNPEENMAEKVQEPEVEIEEDVTTEMEEIREAVEAIARQDSIEEGTAGKNKTNIFQIYMLEIYIYIYLSDIAIC